MSQYIRKETLTIEEVFSLITPEVTKAPNSRKEPKAIINGDKVGIFSLRLKTFYYHGLSCVNCGITGEFFAKEKCTEDEPYHLNLYARRNNGDVLMTKDHILPRSLGGKDSLENMQTMCANCNKNKKNSVTKEQLEYLRLNDEKMYQKCIDDNVAVI